MSDEKSENGKRGFWKEWPRWVKVIAVIWMLLPLSLFLQFLDSDWISSLQKDVSPPEKDVSSQNLFNDVRTIMLVHLGVSHTPYRLPSFLRVAT